jgi:ATP-dependent Clp protease ATP-binding subunit ClpA
MYERFSDSARVAVKTAFNAASRRGESMVHTGHLFIALIATSARSDNAILRSQVLEADTIARYLADRCDEQPYRSVWRLFRRVEQSAAFAETIAAAMQFARSRMSSQITTNDLLLGLLSTKPNRATRILTDLGLDETVLRGSCVES